MVSAIGFCFQNKINFFFVEFLFEKFVVFMERVDCTVRTVGL